MEPDLAGFYVTDDFIDIIIGYDERNGLDIKIGSDLQVVFDNKSWFIRQPFHKDASVAETFRSAVRKIKDHTSTVRSVVVGCYGPFVSVDEHDRGKPRYGRLRETTHGALSGMSAYDLVRDAFRTELGQSPLIGVEPDVVVAALGEFYHRYTDDGLVKRRDESRVLAFVKISHGIGGAVVIGTNPVKGHLHSEMGHGYVKRWEHEFLDPQNVEKSFRRRAPYANRLETLASVGAFRERWGCDYTKLADQIDEHPAWDRQSWYIAQLCINITMFFAPGDIILGGRMMAVEGLIDKVRSDFRRMQGNPPVPDYPHVRRRRYLDLPTGSTDLEPGRPGAVGALCLAARATRPQRSRT